MSQPSTEPIRVLLAGDADPAESARTRLERTDDRLRVETVTSTREALAELDDREFDCVVSAYDASAVDGLEFLDAVREANPALPFVMFAAEGSEAVASAAISAGVTDYVQRDGDAEQYDRLASRVTEAVGRYRTHDEGRDHPPFRRLDPDVTDATRRRPELGERKERYRRLVENAPVPIALYDADGILVYVNDAAVSFVGASDRTGLLGRPAGEFVHPEDRDLVASRMERVLDEREPAPAAEISLVDRDGNRKEAIIAAVPVTYENDPGAQLVLKDITEQKARERSLERQRDRLEEFASIVSHDLRNPLNVATARLALARDECDSEHLESVARAHERIDTLIDDLLTFARVGDTAVETEPVDLATLVESCWQNVETDAATLSVDTDCSIRADPSRVKQLLGNLIRNSVEHGSTGSRSETDDSVEHGSTGSRTESNDSVEHGSTGSRPEADNAGDDGAVTITVGDLPDSDGFYVADDGPGITESDAEQVFESGYSTKDRGTGLGLAIVQEVTDAHDWSIDVTDSAEDGARFEVTGVDMPS